MEYRKFTWILLLPCGIYAGSQGVAANKSPGEVVLRNELAQIDNVRTTLISYGTYLENVHKQRNASSTSQAVHAWHMYAQEIHKLLDTCIDSEQDGYNDTYIKRVARHIPANFAIAQLMAEDVCTSYEELCKNRCAHIPHEDHWCMQTALTYADILERTRNIRRWLKQEKVSKLIPSQSHSIDTQRVHQLRQTAEREAQNLYHELRNQIHPEEKSDQDVFHKYYNRLCAMSPIYKNKDGTPISWHNACNHLVRDATKIASLLHRPLSEVPFSTSASDIIPAPTIQAQPDTTAQSQPDQTETS